MLEDVVTSGNLGESGGSSGRNNGGSSGSNSNSSRWRRRKEKKKKRRSEGQSTPGNTRSQYRVAYRVIMQELVQLHGEVDDCPLLLMNLLLHSIARRPPLQRVGLPREAYPVLLQ